MRAALVVGAVVTGLAAVVTTAPAALGLSTTAVLAHAVSVRGAAALTLTLLAGASAVLVVRRRGGRGAAATAGLLALVLVACALGHAGVLAARGTAERPPSTSADLVVVTLNTQVDGVSPRELAALVVEVGADVVALPETSAARARAAAAATARSNGTSFAVFTEQVDDRGIAATSLLVREGLGPHERVRAPALDLSAVAVAPVDGDGPLLVAVHPPPPLPAAVGMDRWAEQVATAAGACSAATGAVVAGDLNATLDHAPLADAVDDGPCVDAAAATGAAALGTWPARVPALLGAPIDHVLVDGRAWEPLSARVERVGATDHRALVVALARRGP